MQSIGEARRRRASRLRCRSPRDQKSNDIAEVVARIGQQRHRVRREPEQHLDGDEGDVEGNTKGGAEVGVDSLVVVCVRHDPLPPGP